MKKISGGKLFIIGLILGAMVFFLPNFINNIPEICYTILSVMSFGSIAIGFIIVMTKKDDSLDQNLEDTMRERRNDKL